MDYRAIVECNECDTPNTFMFQHEGEIYPPQESVQDAVDNCFTYRCDHCFANNWEVQDFYALRTEPRSYVTRD